MAVCTHYTEPRVPGEGKSSRQRCHPGQMPTTVWTGHWKSPARRLTCRLHAIAKDASCQQATPCPNPPTPPPELQAAAIAHGAYAHEPAPGLEYPYSHPTD